MDLRRTLEREHSKPAVNKIVRYVGDSREKFSELLDIFLEGPYRITQRAAWPLTYCAEAHPEIVKGKLGILLRYLEKENIHDAVRRNTIRMLQFVEIPANLHGRVASICLTYLKDNKQPVAIRVFSMTVLGRLAESYPELRQELRVMIEDHLPYAQPAFISRGRKILKALGQ